MNSKYLLLIFFTMGNIEVIMGQSISLNNLLDLQNRQSPSYMAAFLNSTGEWVSNDFDFQNSQRDYTWYKAGVSEEFEPHTKDQIKYKKVGGVNPQLYM